MTADAAAPRFSDAALAEYREILARYPDAARGAPARRCGSRSASSAGCRLPVQEYVADLMELPLAWVTSVVVVLHDVLEASRSGAGTSSSA